MSLQMSIYKSQQVYLHIKAGRMFNKNTFCLILRHKK